MSQLGFMCGSRKRIVVPPAGEYLLALADTLLALASLLPTRILPGAKLG